MVDPLPDPSIPFTDRDRARLRSDLNQTVLQGLLAFSPPGYRAALYELMCIGPDYDAVRLTLTRFFEESTNRVSRPVTEPAALLSPQLQHVFEDPIWQTLLDKMAASIPPAIIGMVWPEYLATGFPPGSRGVVVDGVDLVHLNADIAGYLDTFLESGTLDSNHREILQASATDAHRILPHLAADAKTYFQRVEWLAGFMLARAAFEPPESRRAADSAMKITALFEPWHIWDGNYPPLSRGQIVRLAFELQVTRVSELTAPTTPAMEHGDGADYRILAQLQRVYGSGEDRFAVFVTGSTTGRPFRFYVDSRDAASFSVGTGVELEGTLAFDHYLWAEFLDQYRNPPNLFYTLRVERIRRIPIPDSAIARGESGGKAMPTHVSPKEFPAVEELETMEGQTFDEEFYLIDLTSDGVPEVDVPLTFIGSKPPQN